MRDWDGRNLRSAAYITNRKSLANPLQSHHPRLQIPTKTQIIAVQSSQAVYRPNDHQKEAVTIVIVTEKGKGRNAIIFIITIIIIIDTVDPQSKLLLRHLLNPNSGLADGSMCEGLRILRLQIAMRGIIVLTLKVGRFSEKGSRMLMRFSRDLGRGKGRSNGSLLLRCRREADYTCEVVRLLHMYTSSARASLYTDRYSNCFDFVC